MSENESGSSDAAWRSAVEKVLRGATVETLNTQTLDGVSIQPLYRGSSDHFESRPGESPFRRGTNSASRTDGQWDVRVIVDHPDVEVANRQALEQLENGANSVHIRFADALRRRDMNGALDGVVVTSAQDMAVLLSGIYLEGARVVCDAGTFGFDAADWLAAAWRGAGTTDTKVLADLGLDPIAAFASAGRCWEPIEQVQQRLAAVVDAFSSAPGVRPISIDTAVHVEAGATEVQELAAALATAAEYMRWLEISGLESCAPDRFTANSSLTLALTSDQFSTIAKIRAARVLWAHLLDACGAVAARDISGVTSRFMMTARDPWVNLLRGTTAALAGVIGGADSIMVLPFDAALGVSNDLARRSARNTQLLLQDESGIGRPVDPAGGSPYVEQLTDEFTRLAWELFVDIERRGGMTACLVSGWWQEQVEAKADQREALVCTRSMPITGVSEFPLADEGTIEPVAIDEAAAIGKISSFLAGTPVPGDSPTAVCAALRSSRASANWERLRARVERLADHGTRPHAALVCLGTPAEYGARQLWLENLLASIGIKSEIVNAGEFDGPGGAAVVGVCGADAAYSGDGVELLATVRSTCDGAVVVAGRPSPFGETVPTDVLFAYSGADVFAALSTIVDGLDGG